MFLMSRHLSMATMQKTVTHYVDIEHCKTLYVET